MDSSSVPQKRTGRHLVVGTPLLKPEVLVFSGLRDVDVLLGGFRAGEVTCVDGDSVFVSQMPYRLLVNTYKAFHCDSLYIDAGLRADPYRVARYAQMLELESRDVLDRVHISRAFTVYQLATLVCERLEPAIQRYHPQTVVVGQLPLLFADHDVKTIEAQTLFAEVLKTLRVLTETYGVVMVLTNYDKLLVSTRRQLRSTLYEQVDEVVTMNNHEQRIHVSLMKKGVSTSMYACANGQRRLQEFGAVI